MVLSIVGQVLMGLLPLIQKVILDDAVLSHRRPLFPWLATLVVLGALGFVLHYQRRYLAARTSLDLQHDLRVAIHRHLHTLDFARHDSLSTGDVMARATGDVTLIQMFVNQIPLLVANVTLLAVAVVVMLSAVSAALGRDRRVRARLPLPVGQVSRSGFPGQLRDQRLAGAVAGVVEEAVSGVRVVKAFGQEEQEISLFLRRARDLFRSRLRTARLTAHYSATLQALPTVAQLGVLALGGYLALHDRLSLGVFLAFCSYLVQLLAPVRLLSGMLASSQQARVGAERVLELLELQPAPVPRATHHHADAPGRSSRRAAPTRWAGNGADSRVSRTHHPVAPGRRGPARRQRHGRPGPTASFLGRWVSAVALIRGPALLMTGILLRAQFHFFFPDQLAAYTRHPTPITAATPASRAGSSCCARRS